MLSPVCSPALNCTRLVPGVMLSRGRGGYFQATDGSMCNILATVTCPRFFEEDTPIDVWVCNPRRPSGSVVAAGQMIVVLRDEKLQAVAEAAGELVPNQGFHAVIEAELVPGSLCFIDVTFEVGKKSPYRGFWRLRRRAWF